MTLQLDLHHARNNFQLQVRQNIADTGVTAIYGPSGGGKTTLLRCIAGLEADAQGRIALNNNEWLSGSGCVPAHLRPIGFVFQNPGLFPHLNVRRNLEFARRRAPSSGRFSLDDVVQRLGLGNLLQRATHQLSGGEQQRVALGRALLSNPALLLMDEPLANLDADGHARVLTIIEQLRTWDRLPILYVSHALDEIKRLADDILVLERGRVLGYGPLQQVLTNPELPLLQHADAGSVLYGTVVDYDPQYQLSRISTSGGDITIAVGVTRTGDRIRVRIDARDVSLTSLATHQSSILNTLPVQVIDVQSAAGAAQCIVRLRAGQDVLLARITRKSAADLRITTGSALFAQFKTVALGSPMQINARSTPPENH